MTGRDRIADFLQERTPRRALALALFIGLLILFRHLAILLVFFVVFERLLGMAAGALARRSRLPRKAAVGVVALLLLVVGSAGGYLAVTRGVRAAMQARLTVPARIEALKQQPLWLELQDHLPDADEVLDRAREHFAGIFHAVSAIGHGALYALIGLILAIVFVLEREELSSWASTLDPKSLRGTLLRWFGFVAEAMLVTVQFQCVVAGCNAVLTFPVLLAVGIPHAATLVVLIFVSGLVPVVGNFVMGVILSVLAYQAKGWLGVGIFTALTFILHKLESYYLNPRLASRHVHLPSFVLIISLLLWEHLLGIAGLFVSFPFLYVAQHIRAELLREQAPAPALATPGAP